MNREDILKKLTLELKAGDLLRKKEQNSIKNHHF